MLNNPKIVIVGGGLVGMAAALSLAKLNVHITLIETTQAQNNRHPSYDDRTLVVNRASVRFWENMGIWQDLGEHITPIKKVHVSHKGHFGSVNFLAKDFDLTALAYVVEAKKLGITLQQKIQQIENISVICPAFVTEFEATEQQVKIQYQYQDSTHTISSDLLLAADGAQSRMREKLQLSSEIKDYQRTAIICNITPENSHNNCAYERFTQSGPTAILPFIHNRCGFVWTVEQQQAEQILALNDVDFLAAAQLQFGYRLGKFSTVGRRSHYPLYLVKVPQQVKSRTILIGNAAHAMSPVSAQGLNLGIRDIACLAEMMQQALDNNLDIGSEQVLNNYQNSVSADQQQTLQYTDDLMSWFKIDNPLVNNFRSLGLFAFDQFSHLKSDLFARASGYRGYSAPLLRQP